MFTIVMDIMENDCRIRLTHAFPKVVGRDLLLVQNTNIE